MTRTTRIGVLALAAAVALVVTAAASAHAILSPPVALDKKLQVFTLSVPTEEEGATTTKIQLTVPAGFAIDSFEPEPGWSRQVSNKGSVVTWSGGRTPTEEDSVFRFNASTSGAKTYVFDVKQWYSNGKVVDWSGPEASDTPAPSVEAVSAIGGGGTSTLTVVALALAGVALLLSLAGLVAGGGRRTLA
jgi:uncharacterized protein YcnI